MQNLEYPRNQLTSWSAAQARQNMLSVQRMAPFGTLVSYDSHQRLFAQGSQPREVFLIVSGIVKLVCTFPDDSMEVFSLRYPGQFAENCAYSLHIPYPVSGFTVTGCEIYRLDSGRMLAAMQENAELANFIRRLQDIDLYNTGAALVEMKTLRPQERLERFFWDLALVIGQRRPDRSVRLILPLSEKEIAQLLGFSVMHLERTRKQLEQAGRVRREDSRAVLLFER